MNNCSWVYFSLNLFWKRKKRIKRDYCCLHLQNVALQQNTTDQTVKFNFWPLDHLCPHEDFALHDYQLSSPFLRKLNTLFFIITEIVKASAYMFTSTIYSFPWPCLKFWCVYYYPEDDNNVKIKCNFPGLTI